MKKAKSKFRCAVGVAKTLARYSIKARPPVVIFDAEIEFGAKCWLRGVFLDISRAKCTKPVDINVGQKVPLCQYKCQPQGPPWGYDIRPGGTNLRK